MKMPSEAMVQSTLGPLKLRIINKASVEKFSPLALMQSALYARTLMS